MTWRVYSVIVLLPIIAVTVLATVRPLQWLSLVPNPMARHFDADGNPDGFSAPMANIALTTGINVVVVIATAVALRLKFLTGAHGRFLSGSAAFTVVLISVLQMELFKANPPWPLRQRLIFQCRLWGWRLVLPQLRVSALG